MLIAHAGKSPKIDPSAWVAPDATICGDVEIAADARIMHGARVIGEAGGQIRIGRDVIVMENAVIRAGPRHGCSIGDHSLIGPNAHVTGAVIEEQCFIATGAAIFHGARIGKGTGVRIGAVVHIKTRLEPNSMVPIGWIAVGDPARILSPDKHDEIWDVQKELNFFQWVYGVDPATPDRMIEVTKHLSQALGVHRGDEEVRD